VTHRFHPDGVPPDSIHDYLPTNHRLVRRLLGRRLQAVLRLHDHSLEDEPRIESGPVLLIDQGGEQWLVDVEEGKANLFFAGDVARALSESPWYNGFQQRTAIAEPSQGEPSQDHPLRFLVTESIAAIDVISREPEDAELVDYFAMCGLRLTTASGAQTCFGGYLRGPILTSELVFLLPGEVAPELRYDPL
jgi:hypothetical protein